MCNEFSEKNEKYYDRYLYTVHDFNTFCSGGYLAFFSFPNHIGNHAGSSVLYRLYSDKMEKPAMNPIRCF
jgi:hypothetical protein